MNFLRSHGLGNEFVLRMLDIYLKDIPVRIKEIQEALAKENYHDLKISVHTLGSHIRDLGAKDLHQRLLKIENQSQESTDKDIYHEQIATITGECNLVIKELVKEKEVLSTREKS